MRKELVSSICELIGEPAIYQGAPTFSYEVGPFHINQEGTLRASDDIDSGLLEQVIERLLERGFEFDEPEEPQEHLTISYPTRHFSEQAFENLKRMVASKETLIMAALGTSELPILADREEIKFPWFTLQDESQAAYYVQFVWALCNTAKAKKQVTAKERSFENPKYAMRCWLLSLGMIGDEYKNARKLLLLNMDGNAAWKNKEAAEVKHELSK